MPPAERVGELLDQRYRLDQLIGRGAMADVYRAHDIHGGAPVAVKILRLALSLTNEGEAVRRFEREAVVQSMVRHRNVAALYGSGVTAAGEPYLVVELLRGKSLRTVIRAETRISPARATSYAWQALQGLAAIHERGILHRDLKPANLMLEPSPGPVDRVALIDFGFATLEGDARLTQQGHVVGSLTYLAPERLRGDPAGTASDVYAIGIILFELLCGRAPFIGDDDFDLIARHMDDLPPPLEPLMTDAIAAAALEPVVMGALAKSAEQRWSSALDMAHALERAAQQITSAAV
jgi:eukaryotic-like serine/threonine-protein kinase